MAKMRYFYAQLKVETIDYWTDQEATLFFKASSIDNARAKIVSTWGTKIKHPKKGINRYYVELYDVTSSVKDGRLYSGRYKSLGWMTAWNDVVTGLDTIFWNAVAKNGKKTIHVQNKDGTLGRRLM